MKKLIAKLLILVLLVGVIGLTGCKAEVKQPEYTFKLYNEAWEEVQSEENEIVFGYQNVGTFEFEYDGTPKCFNAKVFVCGQEISWVDYTNLPDSGNRLYVSIVKYVDPHASDNGLYASSREDGAFKAPIEIGTYFVYCYVKAGVNSPILTRGIQFTIKII